MDRHIKEVRYIKLGSAKSKFAASCLTEWNDAFVHFGTTDPRAFEWCTTGQWDRFWEWRYSHELPRVERGDLHPSAAKANATSAKEQVRAFVEAGPETLWFTVHDGKLWWAFLESELPAEPDPDRGIVRMAVGGWSTHDFAGQRLLLVDDLSGRITKTAGYRSTTCSVNADQRRYLIRRLRGEDPPAVTDALEARGKYLNELVRVVQLLTFKDFELLSEMVLTSLGWRRLSLTGSAMEFADIVLEQPLDGRTVSAQVKSNFKPAEFASYCAKYAQRRDSYEAFYYLFHTGEEAKLPGAVDEDVNLVGPREIARLALEAGLDTWIIDRVR